MTEYEKLRKLSRIAINTERFASIPRNPDPKILEKAVREIERVKKTNREEIKLTELDRILSIHTEYNL